ncbi:MAG: hypothetical protein ACFCBW_01790 [Candidatus Competibacterales bacterium]
MKTAKIHHPEEWQPTGEADTPGRSESGWEQLGSVEVGDTARLAMVDWSNRRRGVST